MFKLDIGSNFFPNIFQIFIKFKNICNRHFSSAFGIRAVQSLKSRILSAVSLVLKPFVLYKAL